MSLDQGSAAGPVVTAGGRWGAYTQLSRQLKQAGLLERRRGWYVARIGLNLVGLVHANLLTGISFGWWVPKHNAHHTNPNHEDLDPDISITALAFTAGQARAKHGLVRLLARYQAWLFFPLLLGEAVHLHLASGKAVLRGSGRANTIEGLVLLAHTAAYLTALLLVLSPAQAIAFVVVHLFPSMPRPNLRRAQPLVQAFCQDHGLPYAEASLFGSYAQALHHLHSVGTPLRPAAATE